MSDPKNDVQTTQGSLKPENDAPARRPEASVQTTQHDQYQDGGQTERQKKVLEDHLDERAKKDKNVPGLHSQGSHTGIAGSGGTKD